MRDSHACQVAPFLIPIVAHAFDDILLGCNSNIAQEPPVALLSGAMCSGQLNIFHMENVWENVRKNVTYF